MYIYGCKTLRLTYNNDGCHTVSSKNTSPTYADSRWAGTELSRKDISRLFKDSVYVQGYTYMTFRNNF